MCYKAQLLLVVIHC